MQCEMRTAPYAVIWAAFLLARLQYRSELFGGFKCGEQGAGKSNQASNKQSRWLSPKRSLNSQTLAAFGAACVDHGAATFGFHTHEKAVRASAAGFGRLISTFHDRGLSCGWERGLEDRLAITPC